MDASSIEPERDLIRSSGSHAAGIHFLRASNNTLDEKAKIPLFQKKVPDDR
jgi:hypothetical protein